MAEHFAWKRPLDAVAYPNIWLKFSAKPKNSDKLVNYQVQDLPEDRVEDAIAFMKEIFIAGEPLAQSISKKAKYLHSIECNATRLFLYNFRRCGESGFCWRSRSSVAATNGPTDDFGCFRRKFRADFGPQCELCGNERWHFSPGAGCKGTQCFQMSPSAL